MKSIMSKLIALSLLVSGLAFSCWFTSDNFNGNYIAGVNNFVAHYTESDSISSAEYNNDVYTALPITVLIKINSRVIDQMLEGLRDTSIKCAILRYRVFDSLGNAKGDWTTVQFLIASATYSWTAEDIDTLRSSLPEPYNTMTPKYVKWDLNYAKPVALFGRNNINPKAGSGLNNGQSMANGDIIIIQYYLNDGLYETGNLSEDIIPYSINYSENEYNWNSDRQTFAPPFIFKVIYNGRKRIVK